MSVRAPAMITRHTVVLMGLRMDFATRQWNCALHPNVESENGKLMGLPLVSHRIPCGGEAPSDALLHGVHRLHVLPPHHFFAQSWTLSWFTSEKSRLGPLQ